MSISINNLEDGTECTLSKYMGDSKWRGGIDRLQGRVASEKALDKVEMWADRTIVKFSKGNYRALYFSGMRLTEHSGISLDRNQHCRRGTGRKVEHKPALCPSSYDSLPYKRLF